MGAHPTGLLCCSGGGGGGGHYLWLFCVVVVVLLCAYTYFSTTLPKYRYTLLFEEWRSMQ